MIQLVLLSALAGGMIPLGAALAHSKTIGTNWLHEEGRHFIIAFGAGALLSAVAFVLIPDGAEKVPTWAAPLLVLFGGIGMAAVDAWLAKSNTQAGQFIAMLADFLPEVIALGAIYAVGGSSATLLAVLIALQNLPEGFNAYRERVAQAPEAAVRTLWTFCALALIGPIGALLGYHLLAHADGPLGVMMLLAAGAILYLMFQDIAPQVRLEKTWLPPLGAILGVAVGLAGNLILG